MPLSLDPDRQRPQKDLGGVLGLYDKPLRRDWLAWWTTFWLVVAVLSVVFPTSNSVRTTEMPVWANALLSATVIGSVMGLIPAYVRVLIRRRLIQMRRRRTGSTAPSTSSALPPEPARPPVGSWAGVPSTPRLSNARPTEAPAPAETQRTGPETADGRSGAKRSPRSAIAETPAPDDLQKNTVLTAAAATLPYPLARACRRLQLATGMKDTYEAALRAGEILSTVLGTTAAAWAADRAVRTPAIDRLQVALTTGGVSQGTWQETGISIERPLRESGDLPGFADTLARRRAQPALVEDLKIITKERNAWAHGANPRSEPEAKERLQDILPPLLRALAASEGLSRHDWLLVSDARLDRSTRRFSLMASRAMGDHPDWDRRDLISDSAVFQDTLYIESARGLIDLTPFVVQRTCPKCNQPEVAYADRIDEIKGVSLKTFDTGHPFFDKPLSHDFARVLSEGPQGPDSIS